MGFSAEISARIAGGGCSAVETRQSRRSPTSARLQAAVIRAFHLVPLVTHCPSVRANEAIPPAATDHSAALQCSNDVSRYTTQAEEEAFMRAFSNAWLDTSHLAGAIEPCTAYAPATAFVCPAASMSADKVMKFVASCQQGGGGEKSIEIKTGAVPTSPSVSLKRGAKDKSHSEFTIIIEFQENTSLPATVTTDVCFDGQEGQGSSAVFLVRASTTGLSDFAPEVSLLSRWATVHRACARLAALWSTAEQGSDVCFVPDIRVAETDGGFSLTVASLKMLERFLSRTDAPDALRATKLVLAAMLHNDTPLVILEALFDSERGRRVQRLVVEAAAWAVNQTRFPSAKILHSGEAYYY